MDTKKEKLTTCSRGHSFMKSSETPVCPTCWPGHYREIAAQKLKNKKSKK